MESFLDWRGFERRPVGGPGGCRPQPDTCLAQSGKLAHALWFLVLIKLVTPPVVRLPLPEALMPTGLPPAIEWSVVTGDKLKVAIADRAGIQTASPPRPASLASEHALGMRFAPAMSVESTTLPTAAAPVLAVGVEKTASLLVAGWRMWLCLVWAGGVLVYAALLWRWIVRFRTLMSEAVSADSDLIEDGQSFAKLLGLRHCPPIHVLDAQLPPLVCAAWPRGRSSSFPDECSWSLIVGKRQAVLVHELAHIRRRDHLVRWFEIFVCGLFWWNPLAWWARRQLQFAEEECCDAWVVWALPGMAKEATGKALLWAVDFRAERRTDCSSTPSRELHFRRPSYQKENRDGHEAKAESEDVMECAAAGGLVRSVCATGGCAETPRRGCRRSWTSRTRSRSTETVDAKPPKPIAESRDLEGARIERLERQLQELNHTVAGSAANAGSNGWSKRNPMLQQSAVNLGDDKNKQLSETLVALDKQVPGMPPRSGIGRRTRSCCVPATTGVISDRVVTRPLSRACSAVAISEREHSRG